MHRKNIFLSSLFLSAALVVPMAIQAGAMPQQVNIRVYDRDHKDYHEWNDREAHSYDQYRVKHPKVRVEFKKSNKREQRDYWNWRHSHPDHD